MLRFNLGDSSHRNMSRDAIIKQLTYAQEKESGQLQIDMEQIQKFKVSSN